MKTTAKTHSLIVAVLAGASFISPSLLHGQFVVGTDGANATDATDYTGAESLEKVGTNTVSLIGNNTYTGGTTVTAGTLSIGDGGTSGSITGNVLVNAGATLTFNRAGAVSLSGAVTGEGSITKFGEGTLTLSTANSTYSGGTVIHSGTLRLGGLNNLTSVVGSGTLTANPGTTIVLIANNPLGVDTSLVTPDVVLNGATLDGGTRFAGFRNLTLNDSTISRTSSFWYKNQPGTIAATGSSAIEGGIFYLRPAAGATMPFDVATGGVLTVTSALRNDLGTAGFAKTGAGTMVLSASNSFNGDTQVRDGTLQLANIAALSGSTLDLRAADIGGVDFTVAGPQTYTLGGLSGSRNLDNAGNTLAIGANNASTAYSGDLSGTGGLTKVGTGTLSLTGSSTYGGPTTVAAGVLSIGAGGSTGAIAVDVLVNAGATLAFNRADAVTFANVISGSGAVTKTGAGTLTLSATNTYTGTTTVSGGLIVSGSIADSATVVENGGWLGGTGTVGSLTIASGGTVAPGNSPGTLNINGDINWLGGGSYNWQIVTAEGTTPGTDWDFQLATGQLDLSALTVSSQFNINLWSLESTGPDVSGLLADFDPNQNYTWTILTAQGGITGYTGSGQFAINTAAINGTDGFANALDGGTFSVVQNGNDLNLVFTAAGGEPIPEPGTWAAAALLVGGAAYMRWRRRQTA
jgi:autotransporter-associated beta strand protein